MCLGGGLIPAVTVVPPMSYAMLIRDNATRQMANAPATRIVGLIRHVVCCIIAWDARMTASVALSNDAFLEHAYRWVADFLCDFSFSTCHSAISIEKIKL